MNRFSNMIICGKNTSISFRNLSNNPTAYDTFLREYKNNGSEFLRQKIFDAYDKFRKNYPRSSSPNGEVYNFCEMIIKTFFNPELDKMRDNFDNLDSIKLEQINLKSKNIFKKLLGIDSILCFDLNQDIQPIKIFFDVSYDYNSPEDFSNDPLDFEIENGFFRFLNNLRNIKMTIILNINYIKNLFNINFSFIDENLENQKENNDLKDDLSIDDTYSFKFKNAIDKFWKDFLSSFTISLYMDRNREIFYSQIYIYLYFLLSDRKKNYKLLYMNHINDMKYFMSVYEDLLNKYFNSNKSPWFLPSFEDILDKNSVFNKKFKDMNPIELYKLLFEPSFTEINMLRLKLGLDGKTIPNTMHSNINMVLTDLNKSYGNEIANYSVTIVLLKRLIPFAIFTECFLNCSDKLITLKNIFNSLNNRVNDLKFTISYLNNFIGMYSLINDITNNLELLKSNSIFYSSYTNLRNILSFINDFRNKKIDLNIETLMELFNMKSEGENENFI